MKTQKQTYLKYLGAGLALTAICLTLATSVRANVYATNIKLNGALANAATSTGSSVNISYILNEPASSGATVQILSGTNVIRTISISSGNAGTLRGLNSIDWDGKNDAAANVSAGTYSVSITAATSGFGDWTQTSIDTNTGSYAAYPWGIDVDKNITSPYYGRVVMSCAISVTNTAGIFKDGLYKMNADGTQADEGWYGNAGYTNDDKGDPTTPGQMPRAVGKNPLTIRIAEDDRIYWVDKTFSGAVVATDMQATTNQIVVNRLTYTNCPERGDLGTAATGIEQFDVSALGTTNAAVYLVDTGDFPNWGVWMWHLTNGVADTNDTVGTQVISTLSDSGNNFAVTGAGVMVDYNLDVFVSQARSGVADPLKRTLQYLNWNGGALPPGGSSTAFALDNSQGPNWYAGSSDPYMTAIWDTVINSRSNPTLVAVAMANGAAVTGGYTGKNGGIRILSAVDGSTVMTNLDLANWYNGVAFDNVGNVYGCSRSTNCWRVWSPPGANQATTPSAFTITVGAAVTPANITGIARTGNNLTVSFTGNTNDALSAFHLESSTNVVGPYVDVTTGSSSNQYSPGVFSFTALLPGTNQFYMIRR